MNIRSLTALTTSLAGARTIARTLIAGGAAAAIGWGSLGIATAQTVPTATSSPSPTVSPSPSPQATPGARRQPAPRLQLARGFAEAAAQAIGITPQQLRQELPGKSLADVARAHNVDPKKVSDALKASANQQIDQRASGGRVPADR